jgi:hypothetical protein
MENLLIIIVAGVEIIFFGSETLLEFLNDTEIFGATLYAWFLGVIVLNTIITTFIPEDTVKTNDNNLDTVEKSEKEIINYELD